MTKTRSTIRIGVLTILVLALMLTGIAVPVLQDNSSAAGGAAVYADTVAADNSDEKKVAVDISVAKVGTIKNKTYTGKVKTPSPKVKIDGKKLKKNRDYTIKYKNNKKPGTATLIIKGKKPNYTGKKEVTFKIIIQKPVKFKLKLTQDSVVASWKKSPGKITGYKVTYAKNKSFTKSKKVKTIESAKETSYAINRFLYKRSYYVKVRAYKKIGKKTYYSDYTTIKSKKAKVVSWYKKISKKISKKTKWIEVDLSKQVVYLHVGKEKIKKTYPCSTGKPGTPTPSGVFKITRKIKLHDMKGDWDPVKKEWGYVTKDVAWSTYFFANAAFHGAPWNRQLDIPVDEKRIPKSHGCVNLAIKNADYLYHWAPTGTLTIVHK